MTGPCKKCDGDSHENSMSRQFLVTTRLGGGSVQIYIKFHEDSKSFIQVLFCFPCWNMTWILHFTSSNHGISMGFAKKMNGFPSDLESFSIKLPSKRHEKTVLHFLQG